MDKSTQTEPDVLVDHLKLLIAELHAQLEGTVHELETVRRTVHDMIVNELGQVLQQVQTASDNVLLLKDKILP